MGVCEKFLFHFSLLIFYSFSITLQFKCNHRYLFTSIVSKLLYYVIKEFAYILKILIEFNNMPNRNIMVILSLIFIPLKITLCYCFNIN